MNAKEIIEKLIKANDPKNYYYFAEFGFVSASFLIDIQKALSEPLREKYARTIKGILEMKAVAGVLKKRPKLEDQLGLVRTAKEKGKPNISLALLQPEKRYKIEVSMPYEEVESLAGEFINYLSCPNFIFGRCIDACRYNMVWTQKVNCHDAHRTAYRLLRKYSGGNHRTAEDSMMKIRGIKA